MVKRLGTKLYEQTSSNRMCLPEQAQWCLRIEAATAHLFFVGKRWKEERRRRLARQCEVGHIWRRGCKCAEALCIRQQFRVRDSSFQAMVSEALKVVPKHPTFLRLLDGFYSLLTLLDHFLQFSFPRLQLRADLPPPSVKLQNLVFEGFNFALLYLMGVGEGHSRRQSFIASEKCRERRGRRWFRLNGR